MAYAKQTWANDAAGGTPLSAARLQHVEDGIAALSSALDGLVISGSLTQSQADQLYASATALNSEVSRATAAEQGNATSISTHAARTNNPHSVTASQVGAVAKAGDVMTGALTLSGAPTNALHAATRQFVIDQVSAILGGVPATDRDTIKELADLLTNDESTISSISAALGNKQDKDSDLTAIAGLITTNFGRNLLTLADAASGRTAFGSAAASDLLDYTLPDVSVTAATATLALSKTSAVTGAGPYVSPAPAASGAPRFAIRNSGAATIILQWATADGSSRSSSILPGEARVYRQVSTLGYALEQGIPLSGLDGRYAALLPSAHLVSSAGSAQAVPAPSATTGNTHQYNLDAATCAFTLPTGLVDYAGSPAQADLVLFLVNPSGGNRDFTVPSTVTWDAAGKPTIGTTANSTVIVTLTTMNGGASWLASGGGAATSGVSDAISKSIVTAKGDLIVGTGNAAVTRLPGPGASNKLLGADANNNITWVDPPAAGTTYTDENAMDAVLPAIVRGVNSGITATYDDANDRLNLVVDSVAYPLSWQPADNNLVASNVPPSVVTGQNTMVAGRDYANKVRVRKNQVITGFVTFLGTLGTAADTANYFAALYDSTGALVAQTADISTQFGSSGSTTVKAPWTTAWTPSTDQQVYLVIHTGTTGGTQPKIAQASTLLYMNVNLTSGTTAGATSLRAAVPANAWSSATPPVPPATLGALNSAQAVAFFAGLY